MAIDAKSFATGVSLFGMRTFAISKLPDGQYNFQNISNMNFLSETNVIITFIDGKTLEITNMDKDTDGKIIKVYMAYEEKNFYIDCVYSGDYLVSVGEVTFTGTQNLLSQ